MRKGQAAMEFLMTYGWAILVVLVAIGALAYFGVLSPGKFLPESCIIGAGFSCDDFKIVDGGTGTIVIRNGIGEDVDTVTLAIDDNGDGDYSDAGETSSGLNACAGTAEIDSGKTVTCSFASLANVGSVGSSYKADIKLTYTGTAAGSLEHSKVGTLTTKVE